MPSPALLGAAGRTRGPPPLSSSRGPAFPAPGHQADIPEQRPSVLCLARCPPRPRSRGISLLWALRPRPPVCLRIGCARTRGLQLADSAAGSRPRGATLGLACCASAISAVRSSGSRFHVKRGRRFAPHGPGRRPCVTFRRWTSRTAHPAEGARSKAPSDHPRRRSPCACGDRRPHLRYRVHGAAEARFTWNQRTAGPRQRVRTSTGRPSGVHRQGRAGTPRSGGGVRPGAGPDPVPGSGTRRGGAAGGVRCRLGERAAGGLRGRPAALDRPVANDRRQRCGRTHEPGADRRAGLSRLLASWDRARPPTAGRFHVERAGNRGARSSPHRRKGRGARVGEPFTAPARCLGRLAPAGAVDAPPGRRRSAGRPGRSASPPPTRSSRRCPAARPGQRGPAAALPGAVARDASAASSRVGRRGRRAGRGGLSPRGSPPPGRPR